MHTSGSVDDVMFLNNGPSGASSVFLSSAKIARQPKLRLNPFHRAFFHARSTTDVTTFTPESGGAVRTASYRYIRHRDVVYRGLSN